MLVKIVSKLVGRPVSKEEAEKIYNEKLASIKNAIKENSDENQK